MAHSSLTQYFSSWIIPGFPYLLQCFSKSCSETACYINTCVKRFPSAQRWLGADSTSYRPQEMVKKLAPTDRKEHNQSSPKHHFCLSNSPNCANKSRRGVTVSVSSLPLGCSLAWPGGKIAMSRLATLDGRSVAYLDSVTFPFLSTYLPKFLTRAWSSCRIRTCF